VLNFEIPHSDSDANLLPKSQEIPSIKLPPPQLISPADLKPSTSFNRPSLPISKPITRPESEPVFEISQKSEPQKRKTLGCFPILFLIFLLVGGSALAAYLLYPREFNDALAFFVRPSNVIPPPTATLSGPPPETPPTKVENTSVPVAVTPTLEPLITTPTERSPTATSSPTPRPATPTNLPTITLAPTQTPLPGPTPFGGSGQIVFATDGAGPAQLFIINADGTDLRQLTELPAGACQPDWSRNDQIVFISPCADERDEYPGANLWLINPDGTGLEQLTFDELPRGNYDPDWSPDGTQIVYTSIRSGYPQIHLLTLADGTDLALTSKAANQGIRNVQPSFSPDGTKIAFISVRLGPYQVWLMNADGSEQTRFSRSANFKNLWPVFTGDGQALIFTQRPLTVGTPKLIFAPLADDGFTEDVLVESILHPRRSAKVAPDGLWLVYESWPEGNNHELFMMNLQGEEIIQLTDTVEALFDFDPDWRPIP
jgi:hypothetical protein